VNILFVGRNAKIGGGTTFRLNISRGLKPLGHHTVIACMGGEMLPRFRELGVPHVWTPPPPWGGPWIERAIRAHSIDVVHASNASPGRAAEWACLRTGKPLVLSVHGMLGNTDHHYSCLRLARRIIAFEDIGVQRLGRRQVIDMAKVLHLPRPIEHRPQLPPDDGPFRVIYVGRLSKRKGEVALNLLEGFRRFHAAHPASTLTLLGDGTRLADLRRAARELNSQRGEDAVRVLGAVPEPLPLIAASHVLVGAGYASLEAVMQGVAVIGAGFWGFGVVDQDNFREAIGCNCGDVGGKWEMTPENFAAALETLHAAWTAGGSRERHWRLDRFVAEEHAYDRVAARLETIYREVLEEAAATPGSAR
jgi:glycosyltransferase involved in cell wall biosynthesis